MKYSLLFISISVALICYGQQTTVEIEGSMRDQIAHLHALSDSCKRKERYAIALEYKTTELQLLLYFNDMNAIADCVDRIGLLNFHLGRYHRALNCYEKASYYYKKSGNMLSYATTKVNEANVYTRLGKYPEAVDQMMVAEEVYLNDTQRYAGQLVGLYANLGLAYFDLPNLDSAVYYYEKAKAANEIAQSKLYDAVLLNNQGDVYFERGQNERALDYFNRSLNLASELDYLLLIATTQFNIGRIYTEEGAYVKAIQNLKAALNLYQNIESLYFIAEVSEELSKCYDKMGQADSSLIYLKQFNFLDDSLRGIKTLDRIAQLELEVALQEEQNKLKLIRQEKELAEAENKFQKTYNQLLFILIILGLVSAFLLFRTLRTRLEKNKLKNQHLEQQQKLLQREIEFKRKEIENFSAYILEKNNILDEVKASLNDIKKKHPDSEVIHESLQQVSHNLRLDKDRKELDLKIDQAHQEFISRLLQQHPKLTKTEQRLCSLILMDLSNKDISTIMNVAPDSVKKARNRLRKKLDLPPNTDLYDFLKNV
ncbi:MAG: tetratricopeptide repeat protein [Crocinitomicaceae bacterium]